MYSGVFDLPWWGYVLVALAMTHVTIASVTIFLHRHQAHRALDLSPLPSHFFRCWLWLTTGMGTKEWASIHRKHHAKSMKQVYREELAKLQEAPRFKELRLWLDADASKLPVDLRSRLDEALAKSQALSTLYNMRQELTEVWNRTNASREQLVNDLQAWCQRAEESGVRQLQELSLRMRSYALV